MSTKFLNNIKKKVLSLKKEVVLYYPGCMTKYYLTDIFNNYKSLLSDLGVDFIIINELNCCGSPLLSTGYVKDFREVRDKNLRILRKKGITRIITNCPHCYDIFKRYYGVRVEHITQTLNTHKHKIIAECGEEAVYHDPCLLARKNKIIKEPRAVLRQAGFKLKEPFRSKEKTFCCGAGGGVKQNNPKLANKIAEQRLKQLRLRKIIVSCPYCYAHLKENTKNKKMVVELSQTLIEA